MFTLHLTAAEAREMERRIKADPESDAWLQWLIDTFGRPPGEEGEHLGRRKMDIVVNAYLPHVQLDFQPRWSRDD